MRYIEIVELKWNALLDLVRLQGYKQYDMWKIQRPRKTLSKVEKQVKLRSGILSDPPDTFPNLKHETGCSLQFIIICAEITECTDKWYEKFLSRPDESSDYKSKFNIETLLMRIRNNAH